MYIPENVQSKLEDFFYQLVSIRNKKRISEPFTGRLKTEFYFTLGSNPEHVDIDNMETTLLDLLQKTRIIENDKFVFETRNIKQHVVDMEKPCISVDITELE